ncbi:MAG: glycoside hydrolase family 73 protein [Sphingomonadaceae bacterium]
MRQLDGMSPTAATAATVSNMVPSRPAVAVSAGASSAAPFSSTFHQVQHDIADYIARGASTPAGAGAGSTLSVEALALRQRALASGAGAISPARDAVDPTLQQQFLASIQPWAAETGARLGVDPTIVAAHAALESGWGQHPLRQAGTDSNNLFGLKAGGSWQGAVAAANTTEFEHGVAVKRTERFRSYPDTASAFRDYAELLSSNPRYQQALNTGSDARAFARGLAAGGYATDPSYADKLSKLATQLQQGGSARAIRQLGD